MIAPKQLTLDFHAWEFSADGRLVRLTKSEAALLRRLAEYGGCLHRTALRTVISPWAERVTERVVDVAVVRIRKKIGAGIIKTVHGVGYKLGDVKVNLIPEGN